MSKDVTYVSEIFVNSKLVSFRQTCETFDVFCMPQSACQPVSLDAGLRSQELPGFSRELGAVEVSKSELKR